jgi:prepilin-type N-terminal cleavage/methylation domain-containing protein
MNHTTRRRRARAFTLIELLTVIAIIGILAAILIPVVGKVRATARAAVGVGNIRQLVMATLAYAGDNRGILPAAGGTTAQERIDSVLTKYLGGSDSGANITLIFVDPSARLPRTGVGDGWTTHFSFHPMLFPFPASGNKPRSLSSIPNIARTIFVADGTQTPGAGYDNDSAATFDQENLSYGTVTQSGGVEYATGWTSPPDTLAMRGRIAFRMSDNTKAKVGFGDGSARIVAPTELKGANFTVRP